MQGSDGFVFHWFRNHTLYLPLHYRLQNFGTSFAEEQYEEDFNCTYRSMLAADGMIHYIRA
jgi:hypothetical protein